MKIISILLSLLLLVPIISAVEVDMKTEFDSGETLMAKISGNFYDQISRDNIRFYRGHVRTSIPADVAKINDEFYIYAQLLGKTPTDYSMKIENVRYWSGSQIIDDDIVADFSITGNIADFSVWPGFVIDDGDFFIQVQNLKDASIDVQISISGDQPTVQEDSISLYSGEVEKILFDVEGVTEDRFETIQLSTSGLEYEVPVYIIGTEPDEEEDECHSDYGCGSNESCIDGECIYQECEDDGDCEDNEACIRGLCEYQGDGYECVSNSDCDSSGLCIYNECVYQECIYDSHCNTDEVCIDGECIYEECDRDGDCGSNEVCMDNVCIFQECDSDSDCDSDEVCIDNVCISQECEDNSDCDSDEACIYSECVYQGGGTECWFDFQCDSDEACIQGECVYQECDSDYDCDDDEACVDSECVYEECEGDSDCEDDEACVDSKCVYEECDGDSDCEDDEACVDSKCVYEECDSDSDCEDDETCVDGKCEDEEEEGELLFDFSEINVSISTNSETTRVFYLENTGDETLEDISLLVSKRLEPYISFSIDEIDELEAGSSVEIEMDVRASSNERELQGQIIVRADGVIYDRSAIFLSFIKDYVPPPVVNGNGNGGVNIKSCDEKDGEICDWDTEVCDGEDYYGTEKCCLGTCKKKEQDSSGKIIGWSIVAVVVLFFIWFYFNKYKGTKSKKTIFDKGSK